MPFSLAGLICLKKRAVRHFFRAVVPLYGGWRAFFQVFLISLLIPINIILIERFRKLIILSARLLPLSRVLRESPGSEYKARCPKGCCAKAGLTPVSGWFRWLHENLPSDFLPQDEVAK
jgi:hypothetical protein